MIRGVENFNSQAWEVHPVLEMPGTFLPALIFTILDFDPREKYEENWQRRWEDWAKLELGPKPPMTPESLPETLLSVAWDAVFHEVQGDKMALLFRDEGRISGGQAGTPDRMHPVMIKSTEPPSAKWLVTRAARFQGKAVCWCIPFKVEAGKKTEVLLTLQNMTTLGRK